MVSAKLNAIPGVPGANGLSGETQSTELASAARRSLNLAEDTVQYFHRVEEASQDISGSLGENTVEKEINKAALGSRSRHLLDLVDCFRPIQKQQDNRPFRVNASSVRSFLTRARSNNSTTATVGSSDTSNA
ncbi:hypothetical protein PM082_009183 [Marasmius tenuissimus]|nr:hypothetical protein PM082_009183 [Marasmius tenuissimus]